MISLTTLLKYAGVIIKTLLYIPVECLPYKPIERYLSHIFKKIEKKLILNKIHCSIPLTYFVLIIIFMGWRPAYQCLDKA
jgi:hypothetical protein